MRDSRGNAAQAIEVPESSTADDVQALYIINLCASNTPLPLTALDVPELGGFAVFRSRRVEDGRDRFRLHLGFFDTQQQAEKFLPLVRDRYPAAWVALAPEDSMGSLDDTSVAQFKFIPQRKDKTRSAPQPVTRSAAAASTPPAPAPTSSAPVSHSNAATVPAENFLPPEEVLSLLESPPAVQPRPAAKPVPQATDVALPAVQSFAVQLIWSTERPDTSKIPRLALFDAYTMYTVTMKRAGRVWYGLRLGFFNDPVSARQVSLYVRSDFSAAAVVPVSERECARAGEAAQAVAQKEAIARQQQVRVSEPPVEFTLAPEPAARAPASNIVSAQEDFRRALETLDEPLAQSKPKITVKSSAPVQPTRKPVRVRTGAARRGQFTTEQLLEELGAGNVSFEGEGHDPLTDTGVRHLSVAVVRRKKGFGGLFSRMSGRS